MDLFRQFGKGVFVNLERVMGVFSVNNSIAKKIRDSADFSSKVVNLTYGTQTRAIILMDSGHVVLLPEKSERIKQKIAKTVSRVQR